ncbi:hypothetical protein [Kitasatospora kifunensis]|uniref:SH3 domain-containing protein n=1 Tax=Kitasatospora kifunensis TaxID=58351 RepID=A0A7W7RAY6_KITKI|nr:hypothetical protein [Kitasatospora kifunensis]MBB4928343.1 hypothetical protein [Kitasatospora kifunensis]
MKLKLGRRAASLAAVVALTTAGVGLAAGGASAADAVQLTTSHWVGIYNGPSTASGKVIPDQGDLTTDLLPGWSVMAQCWTVGQSIDNLGDTWYKVSDENRGYGWGDAPLPGYVFAGYVDDNAHSVNRDPNIPQC